MYGRTKSLEGRLTQEVLPKKKYWEERKRPFERLPNSPPSGGRERRGERKQGGGNDEESPGLFGKQVWGRGWEEGRGVTKLDCLFTWLP